MEKGEVGHEHEEEIVGCILGHVVSKVYAQEEVEVAHHNDKYQPEFHKSQIVDIDTNSNDEYEVDDTESDPECNSMIVV